VKVVVKDDRTATDSADFVPCKFGLLTQFLFSFWFLYKYYTIFFEEFQVGVMRYQKFGIKLYGRNENFFQPAAFPPSKNIFCLLPNPFPKKFPNAISGPTPAVSDDF
jgi:hypothetical protein